MFKSLFQRAPVEYKLLIEPAALEVRVNSQTPLLQAALDQGIAFPHNCRAGGCGTCKCRLISGKVKELTDKSYLLSAEELQQNYILACQSLPRSDVVVEVVLDQSAPHHPVIHTSGSIVQLKHLTADIMQVDIELEQPGNYTAGQYAEIYVDGVVTDGMRDTRSYSFATAAGEAGATRSLRFFIRHVPGGAFTDWLFSEAKVGAKLEGHGPYGNFWLRPGSQPIICIAGGSGLAPIKAILEQAYLDKKSSRDVVLFFGVRVQADLYCLAEIEQLRSDWIGHFEFVPVLSAEAEDSGWRGRRGFITEHLPQVLGLRMADYQAYLCGPPPMIDACIAVLVAGGVDKQQIFFDKFLDRSHIAEA